MVRGQIPFQASRWLVSDPFIFLDKTSGNTPSESVAPSVLLHDGLLFVANMYILQLAYMNGKPVEVAPDLNKNTEQKKRKHPDPSGVIAGIILLVLGLAALYGWWKLEPLFFRVPLYILATLVVGFALFGIIDEFTPRAGQNYSMAAMLLTWFAGLMYASNLTDISALRWLSVIFGALFGAIGLIASAIQASKEKRLKPALLWITAIVVIPSLYIGLGSCLELPINVLLLIPFTFVLFYNEYLIAVFLRPPVTRTRSGEVLHESKTDITAPYRSLGEKVDPRSALREKVDPRIPLRDVWRIRRPVYGILILFFIIFYFIVTQEPAEKHSFSLFYEAVAAAYVGMLAIVIAFAVLVIRRQPQQEVTEHFRRAITGLVQMYVIFALVTVVGLLLGTEVSGDILTRSVGLGEILESVDSLLNVCRLLAVEFAVLAFPVGLLYLYAMIKDFMRL